MSIIHFLNRCIHPLMHPSKCRCIYCHSVYRVGVRTSSFSQMYRREGLLWSGSCLIFSISLSPNASDNLIGHFPLSLSHFVHGLSLDDFSYQYPFLSIFITSLIKHPCSNIGMRSSNGIIKCQQLFLRNLSNVGHNISNAAF